MKLQDLILWMQKRETHMIVSNRDGHTKIHIARKPIGEKPIVNCQRYILDREVLHGVPGLIDFTIEAMVKEIDRLMGEVEGV